ncbi:MAG TPA: IS4 family transposase [Anaerolineae bacterium]|nr:IS4 family transposase [Anaerolineae bacterium]
MSQRRGVSANGPRACTVPKRDLRLSQIHCLVPLSFFTNHPALRLHLCFELNRMLAVQFIVGAGNSNEKDALRQMLEAGVTYIADRGYVCFQLLADIVAAQAHFVIRMKANLVYTVVETLPVELPEVVQHLFTQVTDRRVRLTGAKGRPIYRPVTFCVGSERYLILTDRLDLTTFQVILLYAYRWQVEPIFRFLKRTMNGLHLISTSEQGVTIQFYALLIAALLQLCLKQRCVDAYEGTFRHPANPAVETSPLPGLMVEPEKLASARGSTFLATVGEKLHRYWKISIHWLVTLRNLLAQPFDQRAVHLLGCT